MMNECDDTTDDYYDIFKHLVTYSASTCSYVVIDDI